MLNNQLTILGTEIKKGKSYILDLEVAKLHTRTPIKIPIIIERSKIDGPVLLLMGGVHGDEINGVCIVREIIEKKYNKPIAGTIICIPVFNVFGYLIHTREFPDGRDLNRMFPGSKSGSLASQFAYQFTKEIAPHVDYVIDFHTGGGNRDNAPQVRCVLNDNKTLELAKVFNVPFIVNSGIVAKSIRETLVKLKKTILLFEGGKANYIDDNVVQFGVDGALNVMQHLGFQKKNELVPKTQLNTITIKSSKWLRASASGIFRLAAVNGSKVAKKDVLGIIHDPFGNFKKKVLAPFDCHIFCVSDSPIVNKGDALFHVSLEVENTN